MPTLTIIGGGASGVFLAANVVNAKTTILEGSDKILKKLLMTGGGRCNLCNAQPDMKKLLAAYPRNGNKMRKLFFAFGAKEIEQWFTSKKLLLKMEDEFRVFPKNDSAYEVCSILEEEALKNGCEIVRSFVAETITKNDKGKFEIKSKDDRVVESDMVAVAVGGAMSPSLKKSLEEFGLSFTRNVPSLFTFNLSDDDFKSLLGISVKNVKLRYNKLESEGSILFTHEGISGPAVLKLSSYGAYEFADLNYQFEIFAEFLSKEEFAKYINMARKVQGKKEIKNYHPSQLSESLWRVLLDRANVAGDIIYSRLPKDEEMKICQTVTNCAMQVCKRGENKSEFVRAGGVNVENIDFSSMQAKEVNSLYILGEGLDIDAITGGYNLMACWSEAMQAAKNINKI